MSANSRLFRLKNRIVIFSLAFEQVFRCLDLRFYFDLSFIGYLKICSDKYWSGKRVKDLLSIAKRHYNNISKLVRIQLKIQTKMSEHYRLLHTEIFNCDSFFDASTGLPMSRFSISFLLDLHWIR